jgi:hypothetical protein
VYATWIFSAPEWLSRKRSLLGGGEVEHNTKAILR